MHLIGYFLTLVALFVQKSVGIEECGQFKASDGNSQFPWIVGIYLGNGNQAELVCLGSVIQANAVLTAAHCFCDNLGGTIRQGSFYITTENLPKKINLRSPPQNLIKINKSNIHIHKHYEGITSLLENDLAIIKDNFRFNNKVKPVCIDWSTDVRDKDLNGFQPLWHQNKIAKVEQTYLDHEECYHCSQNFASFITNDKSCIKLKNSGLPLSHESEGAGLVFPHSSKWYIKGVISMHDVTNKQISTYSNVNQFINWISNISA